jgi:hypothetical protein
LGTLIQRLTVAPGAMTLLEARKLAIGAVRRAGHMTPTRL